MNRFITITLSNSLQNITESIRMLESEIEFDYTIVKNSLLYLLYYTQSSQRIITSFINQNISIFMKLYTYLMKLQFKFYSIKHDTSVLSISSSIILQIINIFCSQTTIDLLPIFYQINNVIIPLYKDTPIELRISTIIMLYTTFIKQLKERINESLPSFYLISKNNRLDLIQSNKTSSPDMRISFFIILKEIVMNEIQFLIQVWWEHHVEIIHYIKLIVCWLEHINRDICTLCIDIVNTLLIISFINKNEILINLLLPHLSLFDHSLLVDITDLFTLMNTNS